MKSRSVMILFCGHITALLFGLAGLLIALPHPQLWEGNATAVEIFNFGIRYAGSLHILLGAATMLAFGIAFLGLRKTLIFFFASTTISLSMELLGTSTGFPFGPYAYTDLLGYKILGHVPYAIPLSWFYMGLTTYLLATSLTQRAGGRRQTLWALLLGGYFLTVWDLSLDPSMANTHLLVQFWHWALPGPYFGMPISNLVGWSITGLLYMSVSRLLWREQAQIRRAVVWLPYGMYLANTGFAMLLALGAGLWQPLVIGAVLGLLPATLVLRPLPRSSEQAEGLAGRIVGRISYLTVRAGSGLLLGRRVTCMVEGKEQVPEQGAVLIVARHFHHLYDGCALLRMVPRRLHLLVGLDWIERPLTRRAMELACRLVAWPIVLRTRQLEQGKEGRTSAYQASEAFGYLRRAVALSTQLLRDGEALVVFPEGYPVVDPLAGSRKSDQPFLPFQSGFGRLVELAEADGQTRVVIVPAGLVYRQQGKRWQLALRFGQPLSSRDFSSRTEMTRAVEQCVQALSLASDQTISSDVTCQSEGERYGIGHIQL
jgi:putative membrane protein